MPFHISTINDNRRLATVATPPKKSIESTDFYDTNMSQEHNCCTQRTLNTETKEDNLMKFGNLFQCMMTLETNE